MITGHVNENYEAIIPIRFHGAEREWDAVIDTGFIGADLLIPLSVIRFLGLERRGEMTMFLANEQPARFNRYIAAIQWHDRPRRVAVLESENEDLVSSSLLAESHIEIDLTPGGNVTISELPAS